MLETHRYVNKLKMHLISVQCSKMLKARFSDYVKFSFFLPVKLNSTVSCSTKCWVESFSDKILWCDSDKQDSEVVFFRYFSIVLNLSRLLLRKWIFVFWSRDYYYWRSVWIFCITLIILVVTLEIRMNEETRVRFPNCGCII